MYSLVKTKRRNKILLLMVILGIILSACRNEVVTPEITPNYDQDSLTTYESSSQGISFKYPEDWFVYDGNSMIFLDLSENTLSDENILIYTNWSNAYRPRRSKSATQYAKSQIWIALKPDEFGPSTIIQDAKTISVNGREGATYITEKEGIIQYSVIVKITKYRIAHISGQTDSEGLEDMKNIVNTVAYSTKVLDD